MDAEEVDGQGKETVVMGEWAGNGEKPGGTRGAEPELTGDAWDVWGIEVTKGGEKLGNNSSGYGNSGVYGAGYGPGVTSAWDWFSTW